MLSTSSHATTVAGHTAAGIASAWDIAPPDISSVFPKSLTMAGTTLAPSGQVAAAAPKINWPPAAAVD